MSADFVKKGSMAKYLLALALSTHVITAWAQDADTDADDDAQNTEEESLELGRVQVTGSLIQREDFASTSPMQVIDAETQFQAGQLSVSSILQGTTVAGGTTQVNNQFNGFLVQGGTGTSSLDLRGLGPQRNLVILNGRRVGPSGTRGEVSSLDLQTIPEIAVNRFEILLDGGSSIYGSDAIAGVVNIITRRSIEGTEVQALAEVPLDSGGEAYGASVATGFNWDSGSATFSAQWRKQEALKIADRDFLNCPQDLITDQSGTNIDREDRSVIAGTALAGCNNLYANTVLDDLSPGLSTRYVPSPDGVTIGPLPGYRPRDNGRYDDPNGGPAFYEDVLNYDFFGDEYALNETERLNVYATLDQRFEFWGGVDWDLDLLYSKRETSQLGWRQFFPTITSAEFFPYPNDPTFTAPLPRSRPVIPYPSNSDVEIDYLYVTTGISGLLPTSSFWTWQAYTSYTKSDGSYTSNQIIASRSGDIFFDDNPPQLDYFSPGILSGDDMMALVNQVGSLETGNTEYDQWQTVGILSGDLFQLPAGTLGAAFGIEYREFSIDDQPSAASQAGDLWGSSSARVTQGENDVWEIFGEFDIPIIAGVKGAEDLSLNVSVRSFDYDIGGSDTVWKSGLRWQIVPSFALRGTVGTSYRAPGLFELFLGDQTGFLGQLAIDPCIDWGESTNDNIRANCGAEGIPADYSGVGSSATTISGGNGDSLEAETSDVYTIGLVWTPEFTDLSVSIDYFNIEVNDQIDQLGADQIVLGCYSGDNFPNTFCDLFTRNPGGIPEEFNITEVNDTFVNINSQIVSGIDLNLTWSGAYDWGLLEIETSTTWQNENSQSLFAAGSVEGFSDTDFVGRVTVPEWVTNFRTTARKDDWALTYSLNYASETDNSDIASDTTSYFGFADARRDITFDAVVLHNFSVFYQQDKWDVLVGINNLLDDKPDTISTGSGSTRIGNVPRFASQADWLGRRVFGRVNMRF